MKIKLTKTQTDFIKGHGNMLHTMNDGALYYLPFYYHETEKPNVYDALVFEELSKEQQAIILEEMVSNLKKYMDKYGE